MLTGKGLGQLLAKFHLGPELSRHSFGIIHSWLALGEKPLESLLHAK